MCPRSELRVAPVAWKRSEDLHPDLLRHVCGQLRIATKPAYDRVDVWRMLRPESLHRSLIAGYRALEVELIEGHHGQLLGHPNVEKSFLADYGDFHTVQSFANVNLATPRSSRSKPRRVGTSAVADGINSGSPRS